MSEYDQHGKLSALSINYLTEPTELYLKAIDACQNARDLKEALAHWRWIALDANEAAALIPDDDMKAWNQFQDGLRRERRGAFSGEEWAKRYSAILLPAIMFRVSMVAHQFKVPWGTAYIRLRDVGVIVELDGVIHWEASSEE